MLNVISLEKKFKNLHDLEYTKPANIQTSSTSPDFNSLPTEIYFKIFSYLPVKNLFRMRFLNSHFKKLIDKFGIKWDRLSFGINMTNKKFLQHNSLKDLEDFMKKFSKIDNIKLNCPNALNEQEMQIFKGDNEHLKANPQYSIVVIKLHTSSMLTCLNLVAFIAKKLRIESCCGEISQIKSQISQFSHLNSLDLNFFPCESARFLLNCLDVAFPNLSHLYLRNYTTSFDLLHKMLVKSIFLKYIGFDCRCIRKCVTGSFKAFSSPIPFFENDKKLKIETYIFLSNAPRDVKVVLENLSNVEHLVHLSIFGTKFETIEIECLLKLLAIRCVKLKYLSTDLFHYGNGVNYNTASTISQMLNMLFGKLNEIRLEDCYALEKFSNSTIDRENNCKFSLDSFKHLFRQPILNFNQSESKTKIISIIFTSETTNVENVFEFVLNYFKNNIYYLKSLEIGVSFGSHLVLNNQLENLLENIRSLKWLANYKLEIQKNCIKVLF